MWLLTHALAMGKTLNFHIQDELLACLPDMHAFARFLARDADRAEDLVQDATVRVLVAADQFQPGTNFKAWVFTILRNLYYNEMVRRMRIVSPKGAGESLEALAPIAATQDSTLNFRDFYRAFWQLDEDHREVLMLVGASGLSYEDAASVCGCRVGTIKSRVSRARQNLREKFLQPQQDAVITDTMTKDFRPSAG
jgi:RNA polymerase sigma-70 factor (ECF subfamily)